MKNLFVFAACLLLMVSCQADVDNEYKYQLDNRIKTFHASTESCDQETKVYADENLKLLWNADDRLSVFNKSTYNFQYRYTGAEGSNAGDYEEITPSGLITGNSLPHIYAVYPYASENTINNAGTAITVNLPAEQPYREHSFGVGANTMVAVTDNNFLAFKNVGGYLVLRLYGDDVSVSRVTLQGNNGEKIAGKAVLSVGVNTMPTVSMDNTATGAISVICDEPVTLGTSSSDCTEFWFVVPPTTFTNGIKITVTDALGGTFQATASSSLTIERSVREKMAPLKVIPNYDDVIIQIPDANFKAYCVGLFDKNHDGEISYAEALAVREIEVGNNSIASLEGIEFFKNIYRLNCEKNQLSTLDVSNNIGLRYLVCSGNELTTLDVSNTALEILNCSDNQLTSLDVSNNTTLTYLDCEYNQLTALDVSHNIALYYLDCSNNPLTTLDVSHNIALYYLDCDKNQLTSLGVSNNTELEWLICDNNQLTTLDVSNNTALIYLDCGGNQITTLDVGSIIALENLYCSDNQLTALDVGSNATLLSLNCSSNPLTALDVSSNIALGELFCDDNHLTTLNVSNNTALVLLTCGDNQLTSLDVSNNTELYTLDCRGNQLTALDVSNNTALHHLDCDYNQLTTLDVSHNTALEYLTCSNNQLTTLDVSNNLALTELNCSNNPYLTEIWLKSGQLSHFTSFTYDTSIATIYYNSNIQIPDANFKTYLVQNFDGNNDGEISYAEARLVEEIWVKNKNIASLEGIEYFNNLCILGCGYNKLATLDVSHNTALTSLWCEKNQLSTLDVSNNLVLQELVCRENQLTILDVSNNTALQQLDCSDNEITTLNVSNNTALTNLDCGVNKITTLNVSSNTGLQYLGVYNNQFRTLDVSNNIALRELQCGSNQLTTLDVSNITYLKYLVCNDNQLTTLDVSNNGIIMLICNNNPYLTEIWLKTGQTISDFQYDTNIATIYYVD